jgi:hypothetical protein
MLLNLSRKGWAAGLALAAFDAHADGNAKVVSELKSLSERYDKVNRGNKRG